MAAPRPTPVNRIYSSHCCRGVEELNTLFPYCRAAWLLRLPTDYNLRLHSTMYQGFGKGDGGIVGGTNDDETADFADICESASAEESLMCRGTNDLGEEANFMVSARLNPQDGSVMWVREESESAIMQRTVGMSQMTSMLHDKDRNDVYERALQLSILNFQKVHGRDPIVLDIGTGTGLLAMFAARHGAEFVLGCEMFDTMASIAESVIETNNLSGLINVISAKSTSIDSLSPVRPDILVSELLDSALLGESCMYSHADAIQRFMDPGTAGTNGCKEDYDVLLPLSQRVMPYSAEIFATLVESIELEQMHDVSNIRLHGLNPFRDENAKSCPGGWSLIPVQWPEIQSRGGRILSSEQQILNFEFFHTFNEGEEMLKTKSEKEEIEVKCTDEDQDDDNGPYAFGEGCFESNIEVSTCGTVHAIMLYWKVYLLSPEIDPERTVTYTTKPNTMNWQDHWLQVVFPLPKSLECQTGDIIKITAAHDALRIWLKAEKINLTQDTISPEYDSNFNFKKESKKAKIIFDDVSTTPKKKEISSLNLHKMKLVSSSSKDRLLASQCSCGWHLLCGPERIQSINDKDKNKCWERAISELLTILYAKLNNLEFSHREERIIIDEKNEEIVEDKCVNIILDVSDGSTLSIATARELKRLQIIENEKNENLDPRSSFFSDLKIVSIENKIYSRMFHDSLIDSNEVEEVMMVWDGLDWAAVTDYFINDSDDNSSTKEGGEDNEVVMKASTVNQKMFAGDILHTEMNEGVIEEKDKENDDDDDNEIEGDNAPLLVSLSPSPSSLPPVKISVLLSECFYYQLHSLPTWQAISFLYKRTELHDMLEDNALILPGGARVMAAAIELTDLSGTYGKAGIVSGFDHAQLDMKQENWHEHMFPYKLGMYRKRLLTKPVVIANLDYSRCARQIEDVLTRTIVTSDGRVDCVAVWVDFDLTLAVVKPEGGPGPSPSASSSSGSNDVSSSSVDDTIDNSDDHFISHTDKSPNIIHQWNDEKQDFPSHLKLNLKFFPSPIIVRKDENILSSATSFTVGESDFNYDFKIE